MKVRLIAALGALAVLLAVPAGAGAAVGTLAGSLRAFPDDADFGVVEPGDPRGRIEGVDATSPAGAFSLKLPPGPYLLAASGGSEDHYESFSPVKEVDAGKRTKTSPKLEPVALPRAKGGKGLIPKGAIIGIEGVLMTVNGSIALPINFELNLATASHQGIDGAATEVTATAPDFDFDGRPLARLRSEHPVRRQGLRLTA